jgi:hypothetical protein
MRYSPPAAALQPPGSEAFFEVAGLAQENYSKGEVQDDLPDPSTRRRFSDEQLYALALYVYSLKPPENPISQTPSPHVASRCSSVKAAELVTQHLCIRTPAR